MDWVFHHRGRVKTASESFHFVHSFHRDSVSPPVSTATTSAAAASPPPSSGSGSRISPAVLFIIIILAVIFFISGLVHLLVRYIFKHHPASSSPHSNNTENGRYPRDFSGTDALQRQLQQLFHLHDSGLDQAFIDALPVFLYKEIVGAKEPFDCAVCLCEFSDEDKLRLLPVCSHAFHINCIDTWLLSNSTCPLCRGSLFISGLAFENPVFDFDDPRDEERVASEREDGFSLPTNQKPPDLEEGGGGGGTAPHAAAASEKRIFPVRLGKFRSVQNGTGDNNGANTGPIPTVNDRSITAKTGRELGESSSSNLDARRCYSMGSYQYIEGDSVLRVVALNSRARIDDGRTSARRKGAIINLNPAPGGDDGLAGKKLCARSKGESFSVSKIWQWSNKKGKFPIPSETASLDDTFTWTNNKKSGETDT